VGHHWSDYNNHERRAFTQFEKWAGEFLTRPHAEVGRKGHVCPFVKTGLESKGSIYLSSYRGPVGDLSVASEQLRQLRAWFEEKIPPRSAAASFGAVVQLYPELDPEEGTQFMLDLHQQLKGEFVARQIMIGEFFPGCEGKGIHNPKFRPLQSPVPLFVIRHMHLLDLPFLTSCPKQLDSYRKRFEIGSREDLDRQIEEAKIIKVPFEWETSAYALCQDPK